MAKSKRFTMQDVERLQKEGVIKNFFDGVKRPKQQDIFQSPVRKAKKNEEFELQCDCKRYFDRVYPEFIPLFFHIVNQAVIDNAKIGGMLKALGRRRGVWDSKLQVPRSEYWGLYIEFKTEKGELSTEQSQFKKLSEEMGCKYKWVVIRRVEQFARVIEQYLQTGRVKF
jgi:hypothetical protein